MTPPEHQCSGKTRFVNEAGSVTGLEALGAPLPALPLLEIEIDPDDEWHVGDRRVEDEG